ncbi:MAG: hypothetical protein HGB36_07460 [Chlorobiaceae bacterium]|nr:hypothetical protein [Chlorobiaceae bacterium]
MRKSFLILLTLFYALTGCNVSGLSNDEAQKILRDFQESSKPRVMTFYVPVNSGVGKEIQRLISEGYYINDRNSLSPTEKGRTIGLDEGAYNWVLNTYDLNIKAYRIDVIKINNILNDVKNGTAMVEYTTGAVPTDLFLKLKEKDNDGLLSKQYDSKTKYLNLKSSSKLKKWDKGWRVEMNQGY